MKINKIIIWGHKLHSHTHSYIHNAYYLAFKYLNYDTYWFDDKDDVKKFDFSNSLFITEHQVDFKIPKRNDCLYFVHFLEINRYKNVPIENIIDLKCAFRDMIREKRNNNKLKFTPVTDKKIEFYRKDKYYIYYTLWGTDIFPEKINDNISKIKEINTNVKNEIFFIGSFVNPWNIFYNICKKNNINFIKYGATFNINSNKNMSIYDNMKLTQKSIIAPALQSNLQINDEYVPCRIFKNISYGKMGITNNYKVQELFNNKLIYGNSIAECFEKGFKFQKNITDEKIKIIKELMEDVRDNHTYINRIETMKIFINKNTSFNI
jgi:hypothetical protein